MDGRRQLRAKRTQQETEKGDVVDVGSVHMTEEKLDKHRLGDRTGSA